MNLILSWVVTLRSFRIDVASLKRKMCTDAFLLCDIFLGAMTVHDIPNSNLQSLILVRKSKYVLRYAH